MKISRYRIWQCSYRETFRLFNRKLNTFSAFVVFLDIASIGFLVERLIARSKLSSPIIAALISLTLSFLYFLVIYIVANRAFLYDFISKNVESAVDNFDVQLETSITSSYSHSMKILLKNTGEELVVKRPVFFWAEFVLREYPDRKQKIFYLGKSKIVVYISKDAYSEEYIYPPQNQNKYFMNFSDAEKKKLIKNLTEITMYIQRWKHIIYSIFSIAFPIIFMLNDFPSTQLLEYRIEYVIKYIIILTISFLTVRFLIYSYYRMKSKEKFAGLYRFEAKDFVDISNLREEIIENVDYLALVKKKNFESYISMKYISKNLNYDTFMKERVDRTFDVYKNNKRIFEEFHEILDLTETGKKTKYIYFVYDIVFSGTKRLRGHYDIILKTSLE